MEYTINKNPRTNGYYCHFTHSDKHYYADICEITVYSTPYVECMIFEANENDKVIDWTELYTNRNVELSEESLIFCINEFKTLSDKIDLLDKNSISFKDYINEKEQDK